MSAGAGGRVRLAVLAVVTALAAAGAVARHERSHAATVRLPQPAGAVHSALVAPMPAGGAARNPCGLTIGPRTLGIRHAQLPCGVKIDIEYGAATVLTQVVDQGPTGRDDFQLTPALARLLRIAGPTTVRWRFVR